MAVYEFVMQGCRDAKILERMQKSVQRQIRPVELMRGSQSVWVLEQMKANSGTEVDAGTVADVARMRRCGEEL